jgi:hypothetical protein
MIHSIIMSLPNNLSFVIKLLSKEEQSLLAFTHFSSSQAFVLKVHFEAQN